MKTKARMKTLSKRIILVGGCIAAAGVARAATWNSHSTEPESWFNVPSLWSNELYPQSGESVTIYPQENGTAVKDGTAVVYIPEGSNVTGIAGISLGQSGVKHSELQVHPGATLTYTGGLSTPSGGTIAVVVNGGDLQGGSMTVGRGGKFTLIATNGANVQITAATFAWLHETDVCIEDSTFTKTTGGNLILGNSSSYAFRLFAKRSKLYFERANAGWRSIDLGDNGCPNNRGEINLEDSTLGANGSMRMGRGHNRCAMRLTNSVVNVNYGGECAFGGQVAEGKTDSGYTNYFDIVGSKALFTTPGYVTTDGNLVVTMADSANLLVTNTSDTVTWKGTVQAKSVQTYNLSNSTVKLSCVKSGKAANGKMSFTGAGEVRMRQYGGSFTAQCIESEPQLTYALEAGVLNLRGTVTALGEKTGFHGHRLTLKGTNQEYRCHSLLDKKTQFVYEIDKTGFNPIKFGNNGGDSNNWVKGAMTVKLTGGLQLLHANAVELVHSYDLAGDLGAFDNEEGAFADPNPQLWACGPHRNADESTYGPFTGTGKMGVILTNEAEIAAGVLYDAGRSCGWLKLPMVHSAPEKPAKVSLDLVPQGDVTLQELIDGFTAAGYPAKALPAGGDYNVQLEVAPELVQAKNPGETIVFDFNEYPDGTACLNDTPTVRALVRRANVEVPRKGFMLLLK